MKNKKELYGIGDKLLEFDQRISKIENRLFLLAIFGVIFMVFAIIWSK